MLKFIREHPYIDAYVIGFLIVFFIGIFGIDATLGESLLAAAVLPAVGVGSIWWKQEGFG